MVSINRLEASLEHLVGNKTRNSTSHLPVKTDRARKAMKKPSVGTEEQNKSRHFHIYRTTVAVRGLEDKARGTHGCDEGRQQEKIEVKRFIASCQMRIRGNRSWIEKKKYFISKELVPKLLSMDLGISRSERLCVCRESHAKIHQQNTSAISAATFPLMTNVIHFTFN